MGLSVQSELGAKRFDSAFAARYDGKVRATVPGYDALHQMTGGLLSTLVQAAKAHILVAGAGGGTELTVLGALNCDWALHGFDPSPEMTALARHRVSEEGLTEHVVLHQGFIDQMPPGLTFDGATALLVMHFLPDNGAKLQFLQAIAARLRPGSPFILADMHCDAGQDAVLYEAWTKYVEQSEYDAASLAGDLASLHVVPETRILELLRAAGFDNTRRFYSACIFGGWVSILK